MIALVILALLGVPEASVTSVTGELRGARAVFVARYVVHVQGETYAYNTISLEMPHGAVATSVLVRAPDGVHRLALVDAEQASKSFDAINDTSGARRWAVVVAARGFGLEVSIAAPRTATLVVDIEMQMQTCFYRDTRYAEVPTEWKRVLAPQLRRGAKGCPADDDGAEHLWIAFPDREHKQVGMNAARIDVGDAHLARLEVTLAQKLGEVPNDLATAIVVDASRSMTPGQLDAQRVIALAYARAAADSRVQVIAYARSARALLPSWVTARGAIPRIDRELRAIAPRNGSNVEAAFGEAGRWLDGIEGTKRVLFITDEQLSFRMQSMLDSFARLLPAKTVVHVLHIGEVGAMTRDWHGSGIALAHGTGGIAASAGAPDEHDTLDVTMLLRPIRIDQLAISAPGWRRFRDTVSTSCEAELDEGHSCVWWGEGDRVAGPVTIDGWLWGKRFTRVVTPDAGRHLELARELSTMRILDERTQARVERMARSANPAWSFYAEWGRPGGYGHGHGSLRGGSFHTRGRHTTVGHSVRMGIGPKLPPLDLTAHLTGVIAHCGLGESRVEATVETTGSEIVDVSVIAPPGVASCVEEAIWDTALTLPSPLRHELTRVVLVQ